METQQRRSRMRRTRTGKRIELTQRDIEIFKLLRQYRYLRSTYIHEFVGGASETRFKERLGDLFHEGYASGGTKSYRFFALEADRGTMPVVRSNPNQISYLKKVAAYQEVIAHRVHKTHWGISNLLVLTLTTGEVRMSEMLKRLEGQAGTGAAFLFKAVRGDTPRQPMPQLLTDPWHRAGLPPVCIGEAD